MTAVEWDVSIQERDSLHCKTMGCSLSGHPHLHLHLSFHYGNAEQTQRVTLPLLASAAHSLAKVLELDADRVFAQLDRGDVA